MLSFLKANIKIIITIFIVSCVFLSFFSFGIAQTQVIYTGVVNAFKLNVRKTPSRFAQVVIVIEKGDVVNVLEKKGGIGSWLTVEYQGKKGYIRNRLKYIELKRVPVKKEMTEIIVKKAKVIPKPEKKIKTKLAKNPEVKIVKKSEIKPDNQADNQADNPGGKKTESKKQEILAKIQTQKKMVESFSQKEKEIIDGLNEIDFTLNKVRLNAASLSKEAIELEKKIGGLNTERSALAKEIEFNREYAGKRLKALYKMNMIGRLDAAGLPSSVFDFFLQQNSMKRIIISDFDVLEKQGDDLEQFEILESELKKEVELKTKLEADLNDQIRINKKETLKKELILKEIQKKKRLSLAAVDALREAEVQLDNQIASFQKGEIVPKSPSSFSNYKGRLKPPVRGKIISKFGPSSTGDYKSFTFQKGIDIKVERGEPVKSIFKGEVMFAQWLKGYGNLMIIDHGDNYYTLYAHVEEIFKIKGESVKTDEVIATAGDTGSIKGMCLHFEVRHHGKPENPMKWLIKGV